ncbi:efflux RND transporter periplasmic adaptor subunit [Phaeodactylibacter xiamenensis]|jgi:HlyD family secretion protein|uniref:efflux RND transporter periplasmic adaptor subunit n=1 Tax=Phaeodactylibacter xiamenensis TaxID=1524460 RepID=UPI0024A9BCA9|nr:efflux RND transporter periplasmic adaptor subunit [Phaeodactylibacter xiamenensis]
MSKPKKRSNTIIFALIALIAILVAVVIWRNQSKPKGEKVITEQAEKRTIVEEVSASGKVFPQTEVKISSDVSGEIVDLLIEEGDSVVSGQLLARIDPDAFESQVERGAASVNSAKAQLANARAQIEQFTAQKEQIEAQLINAREIQDRNKPLYEEGVISEADYQQSLANLRALEANLRSAEANVKAAKQSAEAAAYTVQSSEASLKELKTSLRRTEIFAPMSGIISRLDVEEGERVVGTIQMAGTEMMRIANLNAMEVRVEVSENDIPRVTVGDEVAIEVDAYIDRVFKGKVTQIANSATNAASAASLTSDQVTNFEVRINIDPASYDDLITPSKPYPFRPGMSASVDIRTEVANGVLSIPIQAVTTREREEDKKPEAKPAALEEEEQDLMEVVFVASSDTVRMQKVKTGVQDDTYIEVVEGLKEGEEVVTGPYAAVARKLKSGEEIQIVDEDELYKRDNE